MKEYKIESIQEELLLKLRKNVRYCATYSLYSHDITDNDHTYLTSGTCNHKCCSICNYRRQKTIRRKYMEWFKNNQVLVQHKNKFYTINQAKAKNIQGQPAKYSLMHLVLTVPHYIDTGFCGEHFYYARIIELFNWMRKEKAWLQLVPGGEFGVETTNSANGLHIHIHALLLVHDTPQSRNHLHKFILQKWNRLTINPDNPRREFTEQDYKAILKSNKLLTDEEVRKLHPQGTTLLTLETIFSYQNGIKVRTTDFGSPEMIKAIMETISYHFEPHAFDKENKRINIELMARILPAVYKKVLYKKFGCLHGETELNLSNKPDPETDFREVVAMKVDEETGEILSEREFFLLNPVFVHHPESDNYKIRLSQRGHEVKRTLTAQSAGEAIRQMGAIIQKTHKTKT